MNSQQQKTKRPCTHNKKKLNDNALTTTKNKTTTHSQQ